MGEARDGRRRWIRWAVAVVVPALLAVGVVRAITGRVLTVGGKVGSQVTAGNSLITPADVDGMRISANFPEADVDRLALRQKAVVTLADRRGSEFAATVVQVDPVGATDGTMVRYAVLLAFDREPEDLLVGQSASVRVTRFAGRGAPRCPARRCTR